MTEPIGYLLAELIAGRPAQYWHGPLMTLAEALDEQRAWPGAQLVALTVQQAKAVDLRPPCHPHARLIITTRQVPHDHRGSNFGKCVADVIRCGADGCHSAWDATGVADQFNDMGGQ